MWYIHFDNSRSLRLQKFIGKTFKLSSSDFKKIKYNITYPKPMYFYFAENTEEIFEISPQKCPKVQKPLQLL